MRFLLVRGGRIGVTVDLHQDHVAGVVVVLDHVEPQHAGLAKRGPRVDQRRGQEVRGPPRPDPDVHVNDQHDQILPHEGGHRPGAPFAAARIPTMGPWPSRGG